MGMTLTVLALTALVALLGWWAARTVLAVHAQLDRDLKAVPRCVSLD